MASKTKSTMNLTPPRQRSAEAFVEAAGKVVTDQISVANPLHPWDDPVVREDVIKSINLRLPEPYILKLQYIAETTNKSQQAIIREALLPAIDAYIEQIVNTQ